MKIKKVLVSLGIAMAMFLNTVCGYAHTNSVDLAEIMRCLIWNTLTG